MSHQNSQAPDYLLPLLQQVKSTYIQPDLPRKPARPRTYSGLSFLLVAVVAVTLRTFKGLELQRLFTQDARLRREMGWDKVPHRKTIETRLLGLQAEGEAQVAALGHQIVSAPDCQRHRATQTTAFGQCHRRANVCRAWPEMASKAKKKGHFAKRLAQCR